jgi:hypothetical protein
MHAISTPSMQQCIFVNNHHRTFFTTTATWVFRFKPMIPSVGLASYWRLYPSKKPWQSYSFVGAPDDSCFGALENQMFPKSNWLTKQNAGTMSIVRGTPCREGASTDSLSQTVPLFVQSYTMCSNVPILTT